MAGLLFTKCIVLFTAAAVASPKHLKLRDVLPSSSIPAAPPLPTSSLCPNHHGSIYQERGLNFQIECKTDRPGSDLKMVSSSNLTACISTCAATSGCVGVSRSGSACYLKSKRNNARPNNVVAGAILVAQSSSTSSSMSSSTGSSTGTSSAATFSSSAAKNPTCLKSNGTLY